MLSTALSMLSIGLSSQSRNMEYTVNCTLFRTCSPRRHVSMNVSQGQPNSFCLASRSSIKAVGHGPTTTSVSQGHVKEEGSPSSLSRHLLVVRVLQCPQSNISFTVTAHSGDREHARLIPPPRQSPRDVQCAQKHASRAVCRDQCRCVCSHHQLLKPRKSC